MAENEKLKADLEHLLSRAKSREGAQNTLAMLFPKAEQTLQTYVPSDGLDEWGQKAKRRISQIDFAQNYFRLEPNTTSWGRNEIAEALSDPLKAFSMLREKLDRVESSERSRTRRIFFELLDSAFLGGKKIDANWLKAIIRESTTFIKEDQERVRTFFDLGVQERFRIIILHGLQNVNMDERCELLSDSILAAADLSLICDVIRSILADSNPEGSREKHRRIDLGASGEEIRLMLLNRVRDLARSGEIWSQAAPDDILWFWWGSNFVSEVQSFLNEAMNTHEGLVGLLRVTVSTVVSSSGNYERVSRKMWSKLVNLDELEARAITFLASSYDDFERKSAERFLKAMERDRDSRF